MWKTSGKGIWKWAVWASLALGALQAARDPMPLLDGGSRLKAPFQGGEQLEYAVFWEPPLLVRALIGNVRAGDIHLKVAESRYQGRDTFTLTADAETRGIIRSRFMEVDNRFESIIDRTDFRSYGLTKTIRQGERTRKDITSKIDYAADRTVVEKVDLRKNPPGREVETFHGIPGPLADVLSVFYAARLRVMEPGDRFVVHLVDETEPTSVEVEVLKREQLKTMLGKFQTVQISTAGGIFKGGGNFRVWYSTDDLRIPVKFQADAAIGSVYGEIAAIETQRMSRSVIRSR